MKRNLLILTILILIAAGCSQAGNNSNNQLPIDKSTSTPGGKTACTQEARLCPDGSSVGRTGPNCEFTPCPEPGKSTSTSSTVPPKATSSPGQVFCTQEAKACPDGSFVGRIPPKCEFAACPSQPAKPPMPPLQIATGVHITVTLGPTCPVMRIPPDPQCADKAYDASIEIRKASDNSLITQGKGPDLRFVLDPGQYILVPIQASMLPRASTQNFTVEQNKVTEVLVQFDTGIR